MARVIRIDFGTSNSHVLVIEGETPLRVKRLIGRRYDDPMVESAAVADMNVARETGRRMSLLKRAPG
jgi:molecular chaperone DnaK (HSP70)